MRRLGIRTLRQLAQRDNGVLDTQEQQQVEHQQRQLLSETRGFFFAFLVSAAVIIAGVAPLVEAEAHDRLLIVLWTLAAIAAAGLVYALARGVQGKK